jgi:hypothetical protein
MATFLSGDLFTHMLIRISPTGDAPMRPHHLLLTLALAGAARAGESAELPRDAKPAEFTKLLPLIKPRPGESKWATIPWMTDLAEARKRAAREDKPLFVWRAGGGEVLGRA